MKSKNRNWLKLAIYILLSVGFVSAMAMTIISKNKPAKKMIAATTNTIDDKKKEKTETDKREEESKAAFMDAYRVFMHPRCMNCHPSGDVPLQGDDSRLHVQGVKRGPDGKGLYALKCSNCHQEQHVAGKNMPPGAKGWHLPPADKKMVFQGKTPRQLAMHFKDAKFTGFKDFKKEMIHHVEHEPLVLVGWTYGTPPPLTHAEFVAKVKEWIAKGAAIP